MAIDPNVTIGHVHLKVSNIKKSVDFYSGILGFEIMQKYGEGAVFLSAGGYHHHIGLNIWESENGKAPAHGSTGLYHFAIKYPTRKSLADAIRRLIKTNYPIEGASDHGVSEAIYLSDPDGLGLELYWDKPKETWPRTSTGELKMTILPLDVENLLKEI